MKYGVLPNLLLLIVGTVVPGTALACALRKPDVYIPHQTLTLVNPGAVAIGSVIPTIPALSEVVFTEVFRCPDGSLNVREYMEGTLGVVGTFDGTHSIYDSGVPGIGLVFDIGDPNRPMVGLMGNARQTMASFNIIGTIGSRVKMRLVRTTGSIPGGQNTIPQRQIASIYTSWNTSRRNRMWISGQTLVVQQPTCDLNVTNQTLPTIRNADFGANAYAGKKSFSISARCQNASSVDFRFSGTPHPDSGYRFANAGTAKNIGLWLYSTAGGERTIRADGTDSTRTASVVSSIATLHLGAAYWRTNNAAAKGSLNSRVTVNISYR